MQRWFDFCLRPCMGHGRGKSETIALGFRPPLTLDPLTKANLTPCSFLSLLSALSSSLQPLSTSPSSRARASDLRLELLLKLLLPDLLLGNLSLCSLGLGLHVVSVWTKKNSVFLFGLPSVRTDVCRCRPLSRHRGWRCTAGDPLARPRSPVFPFPTPASHKIPSCSR